MLLTVLRTHLRPYKRQLAAVVVLQSIQTLAALTLPTLNADIIDNGIATVAFLTSGGVPLVVEIGVMIDVLFVVVILRVLAGRMRSVFGATDLDDLTELRD